MNNNDYNEPMVDYNPEEQPQEQPQVEQVYEEQPQVEQVYEEQPQVEQAYAYQQFETDYSAVGQNMNNGYAYNNYNSGYTNIGGTVIDSNGEELKNRFGLKLTFSILEMLCCCSSCATFVLGIIACVFTCKANTCYKEGRYEEFKTKAKTATILLIIGAAAAVIGTASTAFMGLPEIEGMLEEFMYEATTLTALF